MPAARPLYIGCDETLFLRSVKDKDGNLLTGATVSYTLRSKYLVDGVYEELDSGTLSEVSPANYEKTIDGALTIDAVEGRHYYAIYTYVDPDGNDAVIRDEYYATYAS